MFARIRSFFAAAMRRNRFESEMASELRAHMEAHVTDLVSQGVPRQEAELRARHDFGSVMLAQDDCRDARGLRWFDGIGRDFRYAVRLLRKSPAFTLTAIATLALCIGANTAVFSIVDAVLFRPLPYPDPDRLATVAAMRRGGTAEYLQTAQDGRTCEIVRRDAASIDSAVFGLSSGANFTADSGPQYLRQQRVSAGFFRVLGVVPWIGREFSEVEDRPGGPALAILSYDLWRRTFASDRAIVGRKITLQGQPFTVIGVMPDGFRSTDIADLWAPLRPSPTGEGGGTNYHLIARVRPGATWVQANTELQSMSPGIVQTWGMRAGQTAQLQLMPLQESSAEGIRKPLLILWSAVALVLLIGCVNIASLLLARAETRSREIATRMALGSGRAAVIRQLLAENLLVAIGGAFAGVVLGYFALKGITLLAPSSLSLARFSVAFDERVLAATGLTALVTSLLFGLYPALRTTRVDIRSSLAQGNSRGATAGHRSWTRRTLIVSEVAVSVVLLVSAGLLIRTFAHLTGIHPGFDSANVMTAAVSLQDARYATAAKMNRLFDASLERLRQLPGIEAAGVGLTAPYQRALNSGFKRLDGPHAGPNFEVTNVTYVTPGYFEALRMTILRGRAFEESDRLGNAPVVIVNESFARKQLRHQEALGSHLGVAGPSREIVGVVGDVQQSAGWGGFGPAGTMPGVYIPAAQTDDKMIQLIHTWFAPVWVVRTSGTSHNVVHDLQSVMAAVDPGLPFAEFKTMDDLRSRALGMERFNAILLGVLAALALLLAAVGIYGLIASSVAERTRELGIRMALGATLGDAIRAVSTSGLVLAVTGLGIGCLLALGAVRVLRTMLWGVKPQDPLTYVAACAVLLIAALLASLLPGLRVARIDPAQTLRAD